MVRGAAKVLLTLLLLGCAGLVPTIDRADVEAAPEVASASKAAAGPEADPQPTPPKLPDVVFTPLAPDAAGAVADTSGLRSPPEGFTDLRRALPGAQFTVGYATAENFTDSILPGYGAPGAWLRDAPAKALTEVQAELAAKKLTLRIYDAYRPLRATRAMVAWAQRTDHVYLLDQHYVSRYSGHNRGNTVDLSVADATTGRELDMGTPWDTLSSASHTRNATGQALENRLLLKEVMERHGFKNYWKEWWHFTYVEPGEPELAHRDVPYGCAEPPEGAWSAPTGWADAGWEPQPPPSGPCR